MQYPTLPLDPINAGLLLLPQVPLSNVPQSPAFGWASITTSAVFAKTMWNPSAMTMVLVAHGRLSYLLKWVNLPYLTPFSTSNANFSSQVNSKGSSYFYPNHAQPICDGSGGYTCGSLSRSSNGQCSSTTCDLQKISSNGGCCPRGQTYKDGKCCGAVGCKSSSSQCTPALSCPTYTSNGICCPSGTSGWTGYTTVCCPKGQIENGSTGKCITNCQSGYEYNSSKGKCEPICDTSNGYVYQQASTGKDICCKSGMKACQTVCCPVNQPEVGGTGVCCPSGSQVTNGKCTTPTGKSTNHRRVARQFQEALTASSFYGLAANAKGALCPFGLAACPIGDFASSGQYECLDPLADLQSCGGCESMGTGKDCTVIPGARWMGCNQGVCEVYSCNNGWKRNLNGTGCERLL